MKKKPSLKGIPLGAKLRMAKQRIGMLESYIKAKNRFFARRTEALKEKLHYAEKSRNALAKLVNPIAVARIHVLTERNVKLELAVVLAQQAAKALRYSWAAQGYSTDMVDAFEKDLKDLLGD